MKPKLAPRMIQGRLGQLLSRKPVGEQIFRLDYIQPCKDIYKFEGKLTNLLENKIETTLDMKQFIPRGAIIKNSQDVHALVVYTGRDTKLVMNQGQY